VGSLIVNVSRPLQDSTPPGMLAEPVTFLSMCCGLENVTQFNREVGTTPTVS
jgi:hypothetical protein